MSKVVYLLGAGASFGKRISKAEEIKADKNHGIITFINPTAPAYKITEGLPIVTEIPESRVYRRNSDNTYRSAQTQEQLVFHLHL